MRTTTVFVLVTGLMHWDRRTGMESDEESDESDLSPALLWSFINAEH